jgi:hypothetical protein
VVTRHALRAGRDPGPATRSPNGEPVGSALPSPGCGNASPAGRSHPVPTPERGAAGSSASQSWNWPKGDRYAASSGSGSFFLAARQTRELNFQLLVFLFHVFCLALSPQQGLVVWYEGSSVGAPRFELRTSSPRSLQRTAGNAKCLQTRPFRVAANYREMRVSETSLYAHPYAHPPHAAARCTRRLTSC